MKLSVDHSFHIGEQHLRTGKPCQDYALSGVESGFTYGIVSDGCSSGGLTDIGARLTSLALKQALARGPLPGLVDRMQVYLEVMRRSLDLEICDMLATGLIAVSNGSQVVETIVLGDGLVVEQLTHGSLLVHKYEWSDNTPFYPAYSAEQRRVFLERKPTLTRERWMIKGPDSWHQPRIVEKSAFMATHEGIRWSYEPSCGQWDLASIAVFSDGVLQVDGVPWQQVVWELMSFKSTNGQFATRRMNRFLSDAKKQGRGPLDDIAMAVIHLDLTVET